VETTRPITITVASIAFIIFGLVTIVFAARAEHHNFLFLRKKERSLSARLVKRHEPFTESFVPSSQQLIYSDPNLSRVDCKFFSNAWLLGKTFTPTRKKLSFI
jgi:hypothetical protein